LCLAIAVQTAGVLQNQRADRPSGECEGLASPLPDDGIAKAWHEEVQNGTRRRHWTLQQDVVVRAASFECTSKAERAQE
jgi:hypothetical protein